MRYGQSGPGVSIFFQKRAEQPFTMYDSQCTIHNYPALRHVERSGADAKSKHPDGALHSSMRFARAPARTTIGIPRTAPPAPLGMTEADSKGECES